VTPTRPRPPLQVKAFLTSGAPRGWDQKNEYNERNSKRKHEAGSVEEFQNARRRGDDPSWGSAAAECVESADDPATVRDMATYMAGLNRRAQDKLWKLNRLGGAGGQFQIPC